MFPSLCHHTAPFFTSTVYPKVVCFVQSRKGDKDHTVLVPVGSAFVGHIHWASGVTTEDVVPSMNIATVVSIHRHRGCTGYLRRPLRLGAAGGQRKDTSILEPGDRCHTWSRRGVSAAFDLGTFWIVWCGVSKTYDRHPPQ